MPAFVLSSVGLCELRSDRCRNSCYILACHGVLVVRQLWCVMHKHVRCAALWGGILAHGSSRAFAKKPAVASSLLWCVRLLVVSQFTTATVCATTAPRTESGQGSLEAGTVPPRTEAHASQPLACARIGRRWSKNGRVPKRTDLQNPGDMRRCPAKEAQARAPTKGNVGHINKNGGVLRVGHILNQETKQRLQ